MIFVTTLDLQSFAKLAQTVLSPVAYTTYFGHLICISIYKDRAYFYYIVHVEKCMNVQWFKINS